MTDRKDLSVVQRFRDDLLAAHPRTPMKRLGALAPLGLVGAIALALVIGSGQAASPTAALAVTRTSDEVVVRIADASAKPTEMTRELQRAGIRGVVLRAPATADEVGTWVKVESPRVADDEQVAGHHDDFGADREAEAGKMRMKGVIVEQDRVRVPAGFSHPLVLVVGQKPRDGEQPIYDSTGRMQPALPE